MVGRVACGALCQWFGLHQCLPVVAPIGEPGSCLMLKMDRIEMGITLPNSRRSREGKCCNGAMASVLPVICARPPLVW